MRDSDIAKNFYPLPGEKKIVALLDATVFGSAKNGMAIGRDGVSWHNDWTTHSDRACLSWEDIKTRVISSKGKKIMFGPQSQFDMSGASFDVSQMKSLLRDLQKFVEGTNAIFEKVPAPPVLPKSLNPVRINVNIAEFSDLITLPGIGAAEANMVIRQRERAPFGSVEELAAFLGLKVHKWERLRPLVLFAKSHSVPVEQSPESLVQPLDHPSPEEQKPTKAPLGRQID